VGNTAGTFFVDIIPCSNAVLVMQNDLVIVTLANIRPQKRLHRLPAIVAALRQRFQEQAHYLFFCRDDIHLLCMIRTRPIRQFLLPS
jgi:hypothetical protein